MSAPRQGTGAWWSSGGTICSRAGPISAARGLALFHRYAREAWERDRNGERPAARLCAEMALALAHAMLAAEDWRCAASGLRRSNTELQSLRQLARDVKSVRYG